ncbi:MAG: hypothetical protein ABFS17_08460 [Chloroflexota bacterium]
MTETNQVESTKDRSYPAVYEKLIPIAIGVIVIMIIGMLGFAVAIATGMISAG